MSEPSIVERLRKCYSDTPAYSLRMEAADEIERLQGAKRRALAIADERSKENVALRQENERLRTALREIVDTCGYGAGGGGDEANDVARRALEQAGDNDAS